MACVRRLQHPDASPSAPHWVSADYAATLGSDWVIMFEDPFQQSNRNEKQQYFFQNSC